VRRIEVRERAFKIEEADMAAVLIARGTAHRLQVVSRSCLASGHD
jgi:hypothetical protein